MILIICLITILGIIAGVVMLLRDNKIKGIIQIVLSVICPVLTWLLCSLKETHAFGGTDWQFLVHTATIDANPLPWIILFMFIIEIIAIIKYILLRRDKNGSSYSA